VSWRELVPEPSRYWIRYAPKRWPGCDWPAIDLVERRICWPAEAGPSSLPAPPRARPDRVYAPPVPHALRAERERWVVDLERAGGCALVQLDLEEALEPAATGARIVDLLAFLLLGTDESSLRSLPPQIAVAVPLLPGLSDRGAQWQPWLAALARGGRRAVTGLTVDLSPLDRRRLVELAGEERWESVFHGGDPSERDFARAAAAAGLDPFPARPRLELGPRAARNRELATLLAEGGELWLRLGRSEPVGQALLAAARHVEGTPLDLAALAREGNLGVVGWLSPLAASLIEERMRSGRTPLLDELRESYLGLGEGVA
jgi:hypothetical protein